LYGHGTPHRCLISHIPYKGLQETADGIAQNDIGFDYRAIKSETNSREPFYKFAPDIDFIKSKGGLTGCFKPLAHKSPPSIGAYEYSEFDPTPIRSTEKGGVISFSAPRSELTKVSMVDLVGRTVYHSDKVRPTTGANQLAVPMNKLSRGSYFVKIATTKRMVVKKLARM
jgi:hypothetical protein